MVTNVVLDLDNTLLNSLDSKEFNKLPEKKRKQLLENYDHMYMEKSYIIFMRPHLQQFLTYVFANFNVSIWTAASKSYALFILDNIILSKPDRKLDFIFFSHHCDISETHFKCAKGLDMLWEMFSLKNYNSDNTVLIDDLKEMKTKQPPNQVITVKSFNVTGDSSSGDDKFLVSLTEGLKELKKEPSRDGRPGVPGRSGRSRATTTERR